MMDEQKRGLVENLANRLTALRTEKAGLEGGLTAIGGQGLSEELEGAKAELEGMRTSWAGLKRRAEAAATLFAVVKACREAEQSRYREPLRQEIVRIGRVVFGNDFDVTLDDSLTVVSRTGGGAGLPVEALSTGAKEQLALLTRLAAAALVDPTEGMPIILDDTLGHTDDYRMELMTAVLGSVSKGSQIILITSSARRYMALGKAKVVDLWAQSDAGYA